MKKYILFIIVLNTLLPVQLLAQQVSFTANAPKVVAVGEQFQVSWTVNQQGKNFKAPDFTGFSKLMGPSTGSSSNVSIINGKVQRESSYTYTYVLAGNSPGKFTLSPAEITIKGRIYKSNPLQIEVVQGTSAFGQQKGQGQGAATGIAKDDVYVDILLSKNKLYVGEQMTASLKVYSRTNQIDFTDASFPDFDGFISSELKDIPNQLQRENVRGEIYYTGIFKKLLLIAQKSGDITIEPFELQCRVKVPAGYGRDWFGRRVQQYKTMVVNVKSRAKTIHVTPLPQPKPQDFTGAVGKFSFVGTIDKTQAKTNDAITLRLSIKGNGNLKLIEPFDINFPPDFDVYDPKIKDNITSTANGMSGTKTFEYLIIPRHPGDYSVPEISFTYFDIASGTYKTQGTGPYRLHIEKGDDYDNTTIISGGISKENVKFIGKDIRYIKTDEPVFYTSTDFIAGSNWIKAIYIGGILLFLLIVLIWRKHLKDMANQDVLRTKKAGKTAQKRLKKAHELLKSNDTAAFYSEILNALYGYVSHKLAIPVSQLTKDSILQQFDAIQVKHESAELFKTITESCEFAQYAPSASDKNKEEIYRQAGELIVQLENQIGKRK